MGRGAGNRRGNESKTRDVSNVNVGRSNRGTRFPTLAWIPGLSPVCPGEEIPLRERTFLRCLLHNDGRTRTRRNTDIH